MMDLKGCQKEATRMISMLRKTGFVAEASQISSKGRQRAHSGRKSLQFCREEQGNAMATS